VQNILLQPAWQSELTVLFLRGATWAVLLSQPSLSSITSCGDLFSRLHHRVISVYWRREKAASLLLCNHVGSDWVKDGEWWSGESVLASVKHAGEKKTLHCENERCNPVPVPALYSRFSQFVLQTISLLSNAQTTLLPSYKFKSKASKSYRF